jgi:hypothetical protein
MIRAVTPRADAGLQTVCRTSGDAFVACDSSCPKDAAPDLAHEAWRTGAPARSDALGSPDGGESQAAMRAAGIGSGTALPMLGPGGVLGVVEVLGSRFFPGHDSVERRLTPVAGKLSLFIQRGEERARFEWMFQHAPDALLRVDGLEDLLQRREQLGGGLLVEVHEPQPLAERCLIELVHDELDF